MPVCTSSALFLFPSFQRCFCLGSPWLLVVSVVQWPNICLCHDLFPDPQTLFDFLPVISIGGSTRCFKINMPDRWRLIFLFLPIFTISSNATTTLPLNRSKVLKLSLILLSFSHLLYTMHQQNFILELYLKSVHLSPSLLLTFWSKLLSSILSWISGRKT